VFGLGRRCVEILESGSVIIWEESVKKVDVFELEYIKVDVRKFFIEICEWCDGCEEILNFFKGVKRKFTNLPLFLKIYE